MRTNNVNWALHWSQQHELITRDDRLESVAREVVDQFLGGAFADKQSDGRLH